MKSDFEVIFLSVLGLNYIPSQKVALLICILNQPPCLTSRAPNLSLLLQRCILGQQRPEWLGSPKDSLSQASATDSQTWAERWVNSTTEGNRWHKINPERGKAANQLCQRPVFKEGWAIPKISTICSILFCPHLVVCVVLGWIFVLLWYRYSYSSHCMLKGVIHLC